MPIRQICRLFDRIILQCYNVYTLNEMEKIKMGKNAFGGWFLLWILGMFSAILARAGKISSALVCSDFASAYEWDFDKMSYDLLFEDDTVWVKNDIYSEKDYFAQLIQLLDMVDKMNIDINFKNTLISVRKEWLTKVG